MEGIQEGKEEGGERERERGRKRRRGRWGRKSKKKEKPRHYRSDTGDEEGKVKDSLKSSSLGGERVIASITKSRGKRIFRE